MSRHEPMPTLASGTADAVLDALPHPVIMVAADGRIANANAAANPFSTHRCRCCAGTCCAIWCHSEARYLH